MQGFRFGLTGRGLTMLMFGGLIAAGATMIGEPDLAWVGVFILSLPVLGLVIVMALPPRLTCERSVVPDSLPVGDAARVRLLVTSSRTVSFSALGFRDRLPDALGRDATFDLIRGLGRWTQAAGYDIATQQRGHFRIGPLLVRNSDAFGVAWRSWQATEHTTSLRVTPRLWPLALPRGGRASGASGDATPQRIGNAGTDDVLVREHRHGDGMRRVHWRMSAKRGELMVRLEEQPWDPAMTIIVDTRATAHIGSGPNSTLEWVLSLCTSLAVELLRDRLRVGLLGSDGVIFRPVNGESTGAASRLLATVTDVEPSGRSFLEDCLADPDALGTARAVVAGLGLLHSRDAAALAAATTRVADIDALVPDARAFRLPVEVVVAHEEACRLLTTSGWNVATFGPDTSVTQAWSRLVAQREAR
ncbi:DUF58 domain-containing protein [[Pseudopropionibacterium] massiliense]|uniref:DUF58 domain-containing protein n=1 Tax=[Pseudopropionibacterium] massiliense TaxID=2220000 RepID=UPI0013EF1681|nr:DUF58 domain-containing protein [[Pseudopropionibacterium] massiliense]